jgi:hypothetical protein
LALSVRSTFALSQPGAGLLAAPVFFFIASSKSIGAAQFSIRYCQRRKIMSIGLILVILLVIFLFGGFSGRFGGYGYGYGHGGVGLIGTILIIVVALMLLGRV